MRRFFLPCAAAAAAVVCRGDRRVLARQLCGGAHQSQGYSSGDGLTLQKEPSEVGFEDSVSKLPRIRESRIATDQAQPSPVSERTINHSPTCADLVTMAERELSAFIRAVTELFGSEQARLSAEDWLDELASMDCLPGSTSRDWRSVTIAVLARLATSGERLEAEDAQAKDAETRGVLEAMREMLK
jgi:hypothetical protein